MCFVRESQKYPDDAIASHAFGMARLFFANWDDEFAHPSHRRLPAADAHAHQEDVSRPAHRGRRHHRPRSRAPRSPSSTSPTSGSTPSRGRSSTIGCSRTTPNTRARSILSSHLIDEVVESHRARARDRSRPHHHGRGDGSVRDRAANIVGDAPPSRRSSRDARSSIARAWGGCRRSPCSAPSRPPTVPRSSRRGSRSGRCRCSSSSSDTTTHAPGTLRPARPTRPRRRSDEPHAQRRADCSSSTGRPTSGCRSSSSGRLRCCRSRLRADPVDEPNYGLGSRPRCGTSSPSGSRRSLSPSRSRRR